MKGTRDQGKGKKKGVNGREKNSAQLRIAKKKKENAINQEETRDATQEKRDSCERACPPPLEKRKKKKKEPNYPTTQEIKGLGGKKKYDAVLSKGGCRKPIPVEGGGKKRKNPGGRMSRGKGEGEKRTLRKEKRFFLCAGCPDFRAKAKKLKKEKK